VFALRVLIKSLCRKFAKLAIKETHSKLKYAAQTEFTKEAFFIPELLEEAQALDLKKKIGEAQIVIALFANRQLLHSLGEHFKVIAICE
jgi:hypothetical protein